MFGGWQQQGSLIYPLEKRNPHIFSQGQCYVWKVNDEISGLPRFQAVTRFLAHGKYLTRCLLSPDARYVIPSGGEHWLEYQFCLDI